MFYLDLPTFFPSPTLPHRSARFSDIARRSLFSRPLSPSLPLPPIFLPSSAHWRSSNSLANLFHGRVKLLFVAALKRGLSMRRVTEERGETYGGRPDSNNIVFIRFPSPSLRPMRSPRDFLEPGFSSIHNATSIPAPPVHARRFNHPWSRC